MKILLAIDGSEHSNKAVDFALAHREQLCERRAAGLAVDPIVREGDPGLKIAQAACEGGYDLLVMGSHGRGLFRRAGLGIRSFLRG